MIFASREDAGRRLGLYLKDSNVRADTVLGLPRGGVVVAAEVAKILRLTLDVLVVRKIGHPLHREYAVGALAENDVLMLDETRIANDTMLRADLELIVAEERNRLQNYQTRFHGGHPVVLDGKAVLLVDDGLATGATTQAAVFSARKQRASSVIVAAPVASTHALERLSREADQVIALVIDPEFDAVGRYYEVFSQTSDEEVLQLLRAA